MTRAYLYDRLLFMHFLEAMPVSQSVTISVLLSGLFSALVATGISVRAAKHLDANNKEWTLKAELRRFRVNRIAAATNGLRECFFRAKTQLEFNLIVWTGFENEWVMFCQTELPRANTSDVLSRERSERKESDLKRRMDEGLVRFNDRIVLIKADAKAHATMLMNEPLLESYWLPMQVLLNSLTQGHMATSQGIQERIAVYEQKLPEVLKLFKECDQLIADEIARPL